MTTRCSCHGMPRAWCDSRWAPGGTVTALPSRGPEPSPDDIEHRLSNFLRDGETECVSDCPGWHEGVVVPAPEEGLCGVCGEPYPEGEQVTKLPLPTYGMPYAHWRC